MFEGSKVEQQRVSSSKHIYTAPNAGNPKKIMTEIRLTSAHVNKKQWEKYLKTAIDSAMNIVVHATAS